MAVNDPGDSTSKDTTDHALARPVAKGGLAVLGAYLVVLTLAIIIVIWRVIPSCDVVGLVVTRINPSQVLTTGGEAVRIAGEGFRPGVTVRIGDTPAPISVVSPFEIAATSPAHVVGRVQVTITQEGSPAIDVPGGLDYVPTGPAVKSVNPTQVLIGGGERLRILGDRFSEGARVQIGGLAAVTAQFVSPSELVVVTPKHEAGAVDLVVSQGNESASVRARLQYVETLAAAVPVPAFQVSGVDPSNSSVIGGDAVTITGSGFTPGTTVRFGGVPARSIQVDGSRFITAVTPRHVPGAVSVLVANDQAVSSLDGRFSFICPAAPDATLVLMVLLAGALGGLVHALRSFFWYVGEQKLLWNWVPMYLVLPFSSSALGFVFYLVIRAGLYQPTAGTSYLLVGLAALVGMFSTQATEKLKSIAEGIFSKAPQGANSAPPANATTPNTVAITTVKPASGPLAGGTSVTIVGTGFAAQSVVRFGQTPSGLVTFVSANTLKAVAPTNPVAGVVDIGVTVPGRPEVVKASAYTYATPKGLITNVDPNHGAASNGAAVQIKGEQFPTAVTVAFGGALGTNVVVVDSTTISVTAPPQQVGPVDVRIDAGADLIAVAANAFTYQ